MRDDTKDSSPQSPQAPINDQPDVRADRRHLLKALASTGSVLAAGGVAPESWTRPVVQSVLLPVHAQTSCGGGQGYAGGVLLNTTSAPTAMFDTVIPRALAQLETTMATANLCITCNGDGTVNVRLVVIYTGEICPPIPYWEGSNIPLGQYRDLVFGNLCCCQTATIRVNGVNSNASGELAIQGDEFAFAGGFSIGPGNCALSYPSDCFAVPCE